MKSIFFLVFSAAVAFTSCTPDDMTTIVHADGSCTRMLTSKTDSAFIAGDTTHNPFPVALSAGWKVQWKYEGEERFKDWPEKDAAALRSDTLPVIACATHSYPSVQDMAGSFRLSKNHEWSSLKIVPQLEKKFRWFYTYYTYQEKYPKLPLTIKIPLDKYMTQAEASFWLTGNPDLCEGMSGNEAHSYTSSLEKNFNLWMLQNIWEEQYTELLKHLDHFPGHPSPGKMQESKDSIFQQFVSQFPDSSSLNSESILNLGRTLNKYFHTSAFTKLDNSNSSDPIVKAITNPPLAESLSNYNSVSINYKLLMPGTLLGSNGINKNDTLTWRIDAFRMLQDDYIVEATSRRLNIFTTVLSMLIAVAGIVFFIVKRR